MRMREHALVFWQMVRRWPRATAIVLGVFAVFYFLYYAGVEAMEIPQSLAAAFGMVLMLVALKTACLTAFYPFYERERFGGSFLLLSMFVAVPFMAAVAISLFLVRQEIDGPPADASVFLLMATALAVTVGVSLMARFAQWLRRDR